MLIDKALEFIDGALQAITADSAVVKLGEGEHKLGANRHGAGFWNVHVNTDVTVVDDEDVDAATITLQHSDKAASGFEAIPGMSVDLTGLKAGAKASLRLPEGTKQYLKVVIAGADEGRVTSYLGDPIAEH